MELYNILLFAHILGAIVLIGSTLVSPLLLRGIAGAASVDSLRGWARFNTAVTRSGNPAAVLLLAAGVWMTILSWSWSDAWIVASLVIFVVMGALAGMVLDPYAKRLQAAADEAPDGPVTPELQALVHDRTIHRVHLAYFPLDMAVLLMMTTKPAWTGAGIIVGVAVAAVAVLVLRPASSPSPAVAG